MKQSNQPKNGDYNRANYNREREANDHDRYPSRDDRTHRVEAWRKNIERDFRPRESSFYGNVSQQEGMAYEKEAGYRERFRKSGEGYQRKDQQQAWPNYQGEHRGKGSKNYKRSDTRIMEDVCDRLTDHPAVDASDIEVEVVNTEVTLTGSVQTRQAKRLAEDICEKVSGVSHVENRLRVQPTIGNGMSVGTP